MTTKSSQIPFHSHSQKPARRFSNKWRNLPAYGHGITPAFKARPVIGSEPCCDGMEEFKYLMPVTMDEFKDELVEMHARGYRAEDNHRWPQPCPICKCGLGTLFTYTKRHRNGKPDYDQQRDFTLCFQCLHISEVIVVEREIEVTVIGSHSLDEIKEF